MNRKETVAMIIKALGGQENIANYTHCVTRLRFNLVDEKKADIKQLEDVDGILGTTIQGGQYQIIIGTAVKDYFEEVRKKSSHSVLCVFWMYLPVSLRQSFLHSVHQGC